MDDDDPPLLVLEDLSGAHWPPPWDDAMIDAVRETLAAVAATKAPGRHPARGSPSRSARHPAGPRSRPTRRRSSRWASARSDWLARRSATLREASETAPIDGDALLHLDVRSDNLCIAERGAVLVDWNHACVGNADLDLAAWLPSLRLEGGPEPEEILPGAPGFAALLAGFFGSPGRPAGARRRRPTCGAFQLAQLEVALPWAARELDLPPPG